MSAAPVPAADATTDVAAFAEAMSTLASGVVLVTCRVDGRPWGMTVTAFHSVSAAPPTVLVSLGSATTAAEAIAGSGRFGVSILSAGHVALARRAARAGAPKYLEGFVGRGAASDGPPAAAGALAHLDCEVVDRVEVADHIVFFGRVRSAQSSGETAPLVHHRRSYRSLP